MGQAERGNSESHNPGARMNRAGGSASVHARHPWLLPCALHCIPLLISLTLFLWSLSVFYRIRAIDASTIVTECIPVNSSSALLKPMADIQMATGADTSAAAFTPDGYAIPEGKEDGRAHGRRMLLEIEELMGQPHSPIEVGHSPSTLHRRKLRYNFDQSNTLDASIPSLSIFCAPKPYTGEPGDPQRRALLSWLRLSPSPKIVLLGEDASFYALAKEFPGRIDVEPDIDYNFYGVPLFHSMLARAQAADTELSMIINGDIILLNDVMLALSKVLGNFDHWVLTAARWDVAEDFPFSFDPAVLARSGKSSAALEKEVRDYTREWGSLHTYGGVDFWMWNNSPVQLFNGAMPPFAFGRGKYDNWLTHEIVASGLRQMVDASESVTSIHVKHSYAHVADSSKAAGGEQKSFWSTRKQSSWELFANINLAQTHGSYSNQKGTALHVPWRLSSCLEPASQNMCLQRRLRPANCSCEYSPYTRQSQSDPKTDGKHWICGTISVDRQTDFTVNAVPALESKPGLPHTMEQLLPQVAKDVDGEKVVILVAVTYGYAEMLMSFVCRLRMLGLAENLVVAALDEELYRFSFTQGLAVYYEKVSTGLKGMDSANCAFGSQCFRQFTKLKSRAVLRVLKAGYSVLWTDVDIVWFKDPLKHLMSYGPGTFPIQSNEPNSSLPGTGIRRINSGFYFARADKMTIEAFEAITAHAATTKLSEQPSFYDILCGVQGELRVPDREECRWSNGLVTIFLDRMVYPNGAVHEFWEQKDVTKACEEKGCAILHNNWITGKDAKRQRLVSNGYWHYDAERRLCIWPWHDHLHPLTARESESEA